MNPGVRDAYLNAMVLSDHSIDRLLGSGASQLRGPLIPSLASYEAKTSSFLCNYCLNQIFRGKWTEPLHSYAVNFLRKIEDAFREYQSARVETLLFSASQCQDVISYFRAISHWENVLANSSHAQNLLATFAKSRICDKGDGTVPEKINRLYNHLKHVNSRIEQGSVLNGQMIPVWIVNDGLKSVDVILSYQEAANFLLDLASFADLLEDPQVAREKVSKIQRT